MSIFLKEQVLPRDLTQAERSVVQKVYRRYYRGKWYESDTPQAGYNTISYYATKVRIRLYHSDREDAQRDADKYNKRLAAYKQGLGRATEYDVLADTNIPETIAWTQLPSTIRNPFLWPHNNSSDGDLSWLYEHSDRYSEQWASWLTRKLLREETLQGMDRVYAAGEHNKKIL